MSTTDPDEMQYAATVEGATAIIRAYEDLLFLERMKPLMTEVAKELMRLGVDFSKARHE